jgi:hypothetical protein
VVGHSEPQTSDHRESHPAEYGSALYFFHPVWRRRAAKQCLWLGTDRYSCRCDRWIAHANTYGYSNSNGDPNGDCDAHSYGHGDCDTYSYSYIVTNGHAQAHADPEIFAKSQAASHASAETVATLTRAKIS